MKQSQIHLSTSKRGTGYLLAMIVVMLLASACSTSDSAGNTSTTATTNSSDPVVKAAQEIVDKAYGDGYSEEPPASGPAAQEGKNVWFVSCGESFASCHQMTGSFKDAATALSWKATTCDSKANQQTAGNCIRQALAAGADGIISVNAQCPNIKSSLLAAKKQGVPVVNYLGLDCDAAGVGGTGEPLFSASPKVFGSTNLEKYFSEWAKVRASYIIAKTGGKATILNMNENSAPLLKHVNEVFLATIKTCSGCKVIDAPFSVSQFPQPAVQQLKSAMLAHPEATVVSNSVDSAMPLGLSSAIAQVQKSRAKPYDLVAGAEGGSANFDLIRQGLQTSAVARADVQSIWGTADVLNRLFAGETAESMPNEGGSLQLIDKDHNLPATGEQFTSAIDFESAYKKVWNGE